MGPFADGRLACVSIAVADVPLLPQIRNAPRGWKRAEK